MKSIFEMTGVERAAALLVALGPENASEIFRNLDEDSIEKISLEIAKIDRLNPNEKEDLLGEFFIDLRKTSSRLQGGEAKAKELLIEAFGREKADDLLRKIARIDVDREFDFLKELDDEYLLTLLSDEQPQTIAVTLSYLPPAKSASILKGLHMDISRDVAVRMARMGKVNPDSVARIAVGFKKKYKEYLKQNQNLRTVGGVDALADMISHLSGDDERRIMGYFNNSMPEISRQVMEKIFNFENIISLDNNEIRILIDEINDDRLIGMAIKGATDDMRFKFLRNMSQNRATDILNDMDESGVIRNSEVEQYRDKIVNVMRSLHDNGIISLSKDKELYVD